MPTATPLTFLFTDLEGSTRLWEQFPDLLPGVLARHDALLRHAVDAHQGQFIKTTGDGLHAAFASPAAALAAVLAGQQALLAEPWPPGLSLRVRMALHTGPADARAGDYFGVAVNRAARLLALAHGGQVLLSAATAALLGDDLPPAVTLRDLGHHRLRDLSRAERVYQVLHPALPAAFPPLASPDSFPNNLPAPLTSFIGRERELVELGRLLGLGPAEAPPAPGRSPDSDLSHAPPGSPAPRLLTLIGPGGTGKTRLSLQLASNALPHFPDGAWLIELAPLADPDAVIPAVTSTLRLPAVPGQTPLDTLTHYLRARRVLLLLDNCEHLVETCAHLADHLLRQCPRLVILASSREALGIAGEGVYRVAPLALPGDGPTSPGELCRFDAIELFFERAAAVRPGFALTEANAPAIAQIARRLDGIPLALELAAARVRLLSPEQIAARLDDRFRLLTGGSRTALPRQQTLRALIDWSYDLLAAAERALLRQLSVFAGGWSLEAAEATCPDVGVLDTLAQLVDKSLVVVDDAAGPEPRYRLLETVRQYARDRLFEAGEAEAARDRHLDYYLQWLERRPRFIGFSGDPTVIAQFHLENENCLSALDWALDRDPDKALRLFGWLSEFWTRRGALRQGFQRGQIALERVAALPPAAGEAGRQRLEAQARAWMGLANARLPISEHQAALTAMTESVRLFRQLNQPVDLAFAVTHLGFIAFTAQRFELAAACLAEALPLARATQHPTALAYALGISANWLLQQSDLAGARALLEEATRLTGATQQNFGAAMGLVSLARINAQEGQAAAARAQFLRALDLLAHLDDPFAQNIVRSELAHHERRTGQFAEALRLYHACLVVWHKFGHWAAVAHELECLAYIARAQGQLARAAQLLGAAAALRAPLEAQLTPPEQVEYTAELAALQSALPPAEFDAAWAAGQALTPDQALALAGHSPNPPTP